MKRSKEENSDSKEVPQKESSLSQNATPNILRSGQSGTSFPYGELLEEMRGEVIARMDRLSGAFSPSPPNRIFCALDLRSAFRACDWLIWPLPNNLKFFYLPLIICGTHLSWLTLQTSLQCPSARLRCCYLMEYAIVFGHKDMLAQVSKLYKKTGNPKSTATAQISKMLEVGRLGWLQSMEFGGEIYPKSRLGTAALLNGSPEVIKYAQDRFGAYVEQRPGSLPLKYFQIGNFDAAIRTLPRKPKHFSKYLYYAVSGHRLDIVSEVLGWAKPNDLFALNGTPIYRALVKTSDRDWDGRILELLLKSQISGFVPELIDYWLRGGGGSEALKALSDIGATIPTKIPGGISPKEVFCASIRNDSPAALSVYIGHLKAERGDQRYIIEINHFFPCSNILGKWGAPRCMELLDCILDEGLKSELVGSTLYGLNDIVDGSFRGFEGFLAWCLSHGFIPNSHAIKLMRNVLSACETLFTRAPISLKSWETIDALSESHRIYYYPRFPPLYLNQWIEFGSPVASYAIHVKHEYLDWLESLGLQIPDLYLREMMALLDLERDVESNFWKYRRMKLDPKREWTDFGSEFQDALAALVLGRPKSNYEECANGFLAFLKSPKPTSESDSDLELLEFELPT